MIGIGIMTNNIMRVENVNAEEGGYYQGVAVCSCKSGAVGERAACLSTGTTPCSTSSTGQWIPKCTQDNCYQSDNVCTADKLLCDNGVTPVKEQ